LQQHLMPVVAKHDCVPDRQVRSEARINTDRQTCMQGSVPLAVMSSCPLLQHRLRNYPVLLYIQCSSVFSAKLVSAVHCIPLTLIGYPSAWTDTRVRGADLM